MRAGSKAHASSQTPYQLLRSSLSTPDRGERLWDVKACHLVLYPFALKVTKAFGSQFSLTSLVHTGLAIETKTVTLGPHWNDIYDTVISVHSTTDAYFHQRFRCQSSCREQVEICTCQNTRNRIFPVPVAPDSPLLSESK